MDLVKSTVALVSMVASVQVEEALVSSVFKIRKYSIDVSIAKKLKLFLS